ncbi:hypothetical protein [Saccharomonospora cyanea]|uniref:Glycosyltransferase RgtA/B/C/D-like domain-containing protein n=1 Tax=Saccharomonospora cyanea NA-134 TaxID=882082 RepID=H5XCA0_9PSEU|nr:hypothetical protein SaccyDRAFT_0164 [Saccharomonospora cyanea NA-134]
MVVTAVTIGSWLVLAVFLIVWWPRINTRRLWRLVALGLALLLSLFHQLAYATIAGDAYVTFRYARNVAEGYGAVYNPGEYVEGYANFLWMIVVALPGAVFDDSDAIVATAVALGIASALGCVLLAYRLTNRIVLLARPGGPGMPGLGVVAAALTAGSSSLSAYGASGLEAPLFVLLTLMLCLALAAGRAVVAGVVAALAVMTRPEGLVLAVVGLAWFAVEAVRRRQAGSTAVAYVVGVVVLLVPWTVWRLTIYEHLLPNVVVSRWKGGWSDRLAGGWEYVAEFALAYQAFVALAVTALALLLTRRGVPESVARARSVVWLLVALAVGHVVGVLAAGGGWMPAWRLLAPVPVLLAIVGTAAYGLFVVTSPAREAPTSAEPEPRSPLARRRTVSVVTMALCGLSLVVTMVHPRALPAMHELRASADQLAEVGRWLDESLPAGTVISTHNTGALAYEAGPSIVVVDVFGRTDEHIAREGEPLRVAGHSVYLTRDFDYVVNTRSPAVAVEESGYTTEQECGINPAYAGLYEVASFRREGTPYWVSVYVRRVSASYLLELLDAHPDFTYVSCL